ncbi:MAG: Fe-S cluster assembly protein SufD [Pseudomonadota bacterium]
MSANTAMTLDRYRETLAQDQPQLAADSPPWLAQHRRDAAHSLRVLGFPQRRQEAWRYTSIDRLLQHDFVPDAGLAEPVIDIERWRLPRLDAHRVVLVNGRFVRGLSSLAELPPGVTVGGLKQQITGNSMLPACWLGLTAGEPAHIFNALNSAAMEDGLFIHLGRDQRLDRPIEVLHLTDVPGAPVVAHSRNLVLLEPGAQATLVERFAGMDGSLYFSNGLSEIVLLDGAGLEHYRLQEESHTAFHLHSLFIKQHEGSHYRNSGYVLGGTWSRTELTIDFAGTAAAAELDGLYLAGEQQLSDVHIDIRHGVPGCTSRSRYKGLLHGRGRAVFDGRIEVSAHAGKSDAHLHNDNLLLSRNAEVDTKPQLVIHADDVRCSHGTTVGQLDQAQLFYLRSRGIETADARRLLCLGFVGEILERCRIAPLRKRIEAGISRRLLDAGDIIAEHSK